MAANQAEIIQAIQSLRGLYFLASHVPAMDIQLNEKEIKKAKRECIHVDRQSHEEIEQAKRQLLETGFQVPDAWLNVEAIGVTRQESRRIRNSVDAPFRHRLIRAAPNVKALKSVCREMYVACLRLEASGPKDAPPKRLASKRHSPDFSEVTWEGKRYRFSPTQANAMKILWRAWETGAPTVRGDYIVQELDIGASRTLAGVFRGQEAWGKLIVAVGKGAYCLNDPSDPALQIAADEKTKHARPKKGKRIGTRIGKRIGTRKK